MSFGTECLSNPLPPRFHSSLNGGLLIFGRDSRRPLLQLNSALGIVITRLSQFRAPVCSMRVHTHGPTSVPTNTLATRVFFAQTRRRPNPPRTWAGVFVHEFLVTNTTAIRYLHAHSCVHVRTYVLLDSYTRIIGYVSSCTYIYIYIYIIYIRVYICIHIYIYVLFCRLFSAWERESRDKNAQFAGERRVRVRECRRKERTRRRRRGSACGANQV